MVMSQQQNAEFATSTEIPMGDSCGAQIPYPSLSFNVPSCNPPSEDHGLRQNGDISTSSNNNDQVVDQTIPSVQDSMIQIPAACTSSSGLASAAQGYSGYAAYPNSDPYGNSSANYAVYYAQYQQNIYQQPGQYQQQSAQYHQQPSSYQTDPSYTQQVGGGQNTGAPYQPLSSFQNTGSYPEPASYSSTYYNPGDYQTSGSYPNGSYSTHYWHGAQYANYNAHQYSNYTSDPNHAYASTTGVAAPQYEQHFKQWNGYYNQSPTEVICAPGTEKNIPVSTSSTPSNFSTSGSVGFTHSNQIPAVYPSPWRPESDQSAVTPGQAVSVTGNPPEGYWNYGAPNSQNHTVNPVPPLVQNTTELATQYESYQIQQNPSFVHGSAVSDTISHQGPQTQHIYSQITAQPPETFDSRKTLQIPTNPRIASSLPPTLSRTDKDSIPTSTMSKPAYVSVMTDKVTGEEGDSMLKPGTFPRSLRGYVERALARCTNDRQKLACQSIMKEIITKATAEGTLHTRDWDVEPLFPIPNDDTLNEGKFSFSFPAFVIQKSKSPNRRAKSRWEPIEERAVGKPAQSSYAPARYGFPNLKQFSGGVLEHKGNLGTKFPFTDQESSVKSAVRPAKKQRVGDDPSSANDKGSSSDSDKEQSLTKYYAAAIALSDTPEEKKRRENRSKRFEKGQRTEASTGKANGVASGPRARRAGAVFLSKSLEESGGRAVEDIDWDALIIKGTCQEIEKRYLRLTSAPEPAAVRPEDVLEKALLMVQNTPKNYLFKCDQLKSIRQDLTVQHIRNEFTAKVYETHARFAIEAGDLPEFNQCQSQLKTLYAEGIVGCHMEFAAYNLLSVILHSSNNRDLLSAMSRLSVSAKEDEAVKHALSVRRAVASENYVMFFRLYKSAPNLNALFMDLCVERVRYAAVKCMSRSHRPTVPVSYLSQVLGFSDTLPENETCVENKVGGFDECIGWLKAHGACIISESSGEVLLDTKASVSSLYMPDPEDAVSHGDTNLAVNDFLTRSSS